MLVKMIFIRQCAFFIYSLLIAVSAYSSSPLLDEFTYEGQYDQSGVPHGQGVATFLIGTYTGSFVEGVPDGEGEVDFPGFFKGDTQGFIYKGGISKGYLSGTGSITYNNGLRFEGQFKDNKVNGFASMYGVDGKLVYEGVFLDFVFHGQGKLFAIDHVYEGEFEAGQLHGKGKQTYPDGQVFEGTFVNGEAVGFARYSDGQGFTVEGFFQYGDFHDVVNIKYVNGATYTGDTLNMQPQGQGKLIFPGSYVYQGKFRAGKFSGQGRIEFVNGDSYVGEFKYGSYYGEGTLVQGGVTYEGLFRNGEYLGPSEE